MPDRGHPRLGLAGRLETLDVGGDCTQQGVCLEPCEHPSDTGMHAITPADMTTIVTLYVESVRLRPFARIPVSGGEHEAATLALRDDDSLDLHIPHGDAACH